MTDTANTSFSTLALPAALTDNLASLGYQTMTPVQAASLPLILAGRDVIAKAKTGSGKTAAFGLGVLARLNVKRFRVQSLVLCPTRELADQVAVEIRKLGRGIHNIKVLTLCGGVPFGPQLGSLEHGAHIIVGTPGRVLEHLEKGSLRLDELNTLVLDEADRMLDMGFAPALDSILALAPAKRMTLLFSATYPNAIADIAKRIMQDPAVVEVANPIQQNLISQRFFSVENTQSRVQATIALLSKAEFLPANGDPSGVTSCVVFCNTRKETQQLADALYEAGFSVLALHGDYEQREREQILIRFANKSVTVLVATDVAARGLDIDALDVVINYQLAHDTDTHVHRIGRTGRAGSQGLAYSLVGPTDDYKLAMLADLYPEALLPLTAAPQAEVRLQRQQARMITLQIDGGKRQKLRAGDILGALTADQQLTREHIGKINLLDDVAYVAIVRAQGKSALQKLSQGIKGRSFRARLID